MSDTQRQNQPIDYLDRPLTPERLRAYLQGQEREHDESELERLNIPRPGDEREDPCD